MTRSELLEAIAKADRAFIYVAIGSHGFYVEVVQDDLLMQIETARSMLSFPLPAEWGSQESTSRMLYIG